MLLLPTEEWIIKSNEWLQTITLFMPLCCCSLLYLHWDTSTPSPARVTHTLAAVLLSPETLWFLASLSLSWSLLDPFYSLFSTQTTLWIKDPRVQPLNFFYMTKCPYRHREHTSKLSSDSVSVREWMQMCVCACVCMCVLTLCIQ